MNIIDEINTNEEVAFNVIKSIKNSEEFFKSKLLIMH